MYSCAFSFEVRMRGGKQPATAYWTVSDGVLSVSSSLWTTLGTRSSPSRRWRASAPYRMTMASLTKSENFESFLVWSSAFSNIIMSSSTLSAPWIVMTVAALSIISSRTTGFRSPTALSLIKNCTKSTSLDESKMGANDLKASAIPLLASQGSARFVFLGIPNSSLSGTLGLDRSQYHSSNRWSKSENVNWYFAAHSAIALDAARRNCLSTLAR